MDLAFIDLNVCARISYSLGTALQSFFSLKSEALHKLKKKKKSAEGFWIKSLIKKRLTDLSGLQDKIRLFFYPNQILLLLHN